MRYRLELKLSPDTKRWIATVPDLPDVAAGGDNPDQARRNARDAISQWIETRMLEGGKIPPASSLCVNCEKTAGRAVGHEWDDAIADTNDGIWCSACAADALVENEVLQDKVAELDMLLTREYCDDAGLNFRERAENAESALRLVAQGHLLPHENITIAREALSAVNEVKVPERPETSSSWSDADIIKMAEEFEAQAKQTYVVHTQASLHRAAAHLRLAFAEVILITPLDNVG